MPRCGSRRSQSAHTDQEQSPLQPDNDGSTDHNPPPQPPANEIGVRGDGAGLEVGQEEPLAEQLWTTTVHVTVICWPAGTVRHSQRPPRGFQEVFGNFERCRALVDGQLMAARANIVASNTPKPVAPRPINQRN